jgi:hypothetical protein
MSAWTGRYFIVWGGSLQAGATDLPAHDGALYDPENDTWMPMAGSGAPAGRWSAASVWTGSELLIWGGIGCGSDSSGGFLACGDGARFRPADMSWQPITSVGAPPARAPNSVWSGSRLLIWGNLFGSGGGASYDPNADRWDALGATGEPMPLLSFSSVWAGDRMIVWGGDVALSDVELPTNTGAAYFP